MANCYSKQRRLSIQDLGTREQVIPFIRQHKKIIQALQKFDNPFEGIKEEQLYEWNKNISFQQTNTLIYKGRKQNDRFDGKVIMFNKNTKNLLIGIFQSNKIKNNICRKIFSNGDVYLGCVNKQFKLNGKGILEKKDQIYDGNFQQNLYSGVGVLKKKNSNKKYSGNFKNGQIEKGTLQTNQTIYKGKFKNNMKYDDNGRLEWKNGGYYVGQFYNDQMHGNGKLYNTQKQLVRNVTWVHGYMTNK